MPRRSIPPETPGPVTRLPERPSLEFERKRAKRLLRELHAGDAGALERARRQRVGTRRPGAAAGLRLADAQLVLAREYGFSSWPRLVEYFSTWERHDRAGPNPDRHQRSHYEFRVRVLLDAHRDGRRPYLPALAAFVPRLYGRTDAEILATPLSEQEAQLAVARTARFSSWAALLAHAERAEVGHGELLRGPLTEAVTAVRENDRGPVRRVAAAHPELLDEILRSALLHEQRERTARARATTDWVVSLGADLGGTLSRILLGFIHAETEAVAYFLERGADPGWLPPSGVSVLEHALLKYWNPEAVDLVARRVEPRRAFWIAAGLGDVRTMLGFLDAAGAPTEAARRDRPDFVAVGLPGPACRPDVDDLEIVWEAFLVAGFNQRLEALDALLDRGFPIDHASWGSTLLEWAQGNRIAPLAEHLRKRGATPRGR